MTEFTGERVVPGQVNDDLWAEHISRYAFACRFASHRDVLDVGSGTGYGTAELAQSAHSVQGIDVSPDAISYAQSNYPLANIKFFEASATNVPIADSSFDLITAFEVIEHLEDSRALLKEASRLLRPGGIFLVSTPNKLYYTESRGDQGPNPYHTHEFTYAEFRTALAEYFPQTAVFLQNRMEAFAFYPHATYQPVAAEMAGSRGTPDEAHFFLGICSNTTMPPLESFIYVPRAANVLKEREHHITLLRTELQTARAERDRIIEIHDQQTKHLEQQNEWAKDLDRRLKESGNELTAAVKALDKAEATVIERTHWAQRLDRQLNLVKSSGWLRLGVRLGLGPKIDTDV
ncbi:MAG: methyltransferase domain-containing protein [Bryobacteraceae bacterium]